MIALNAMSPTMDRTLRWPWLKLSYAMVFCPRSVNRTSRRSRKGEYITSTDSSKQASTAWRQATSCGDDFSVSSSFSLYRRNQFRRSADDTRGTWLLR